jgi:hypothetical protein
MTLNITSLIKFTVALVLCCAFTAHADPLVTSWFTANTGKYARIYTSLANRTNGISTTTWTGQSSPTYAGVHEVNYSASWVYVKDTGLAAYVMGPWNNPNLPKNQGTSTKVIRFPRTPTIPTSKTLTSMGAIGYLVDGVSVYNTSDGFSYSYANSKDASPIAGIGTGDGIWNRDALPNEGGSFDVALNHPQPSGDYHAHANPIGVRYLLGDNINFDSASKAYTENTNTVTFKHSPLIGWALDGIPIYGPYGYSVPTNATSGVRRMISGYVFRDGTYGTTNLTATGRTSLPLWAQAAQSKTTLTSSQYGPAVNGTYPLGHFSEDYDYLGDLGFIQSATNTVGNYTTSYDLNKYNARYCVTPEYPNGTWAYFITIKTDGTSWYPYNVGRWYFGSPTGGNSTLTVMNADAPLTTYFKGATNLTEVITPPIVNGANGNVTLVWSALEGGTYQVNVSTNLTTWTTNTALTTTATNNSLSVIETGSATTNPKRFYRIARTAVATFDATGY